MDVMVVGWHRVKYVEMYLNLSCSFANWRNLYRNILQCWAFRVSGNRCCKGMVLWGGVGGGMVLWGGVGEGWYCEVGWGDGWYCEVGWGVVLWGGVAGGMVLWGGVGGWVVLWVGVGGGVVLWGGVVRGEYGNVNPWFYCPCLHHRPSPTFRKSWCSQIWYFEMQTYITF